MRPIDKRITAIPYFGGKTPYVFWLYSLFPKGVHLVDGMCGSGTVSINAPAKDFPLITINDINRDVINFFMVMRENFDELFQKLSYTPYSREEFYTAAEPCDEPVEKARRFFIRASQGFSGMGSQNTEKGWGYECAVHNKYNGKQRGHFRVTTWNTKLNYLHLIADRLRTMQIENRSIFDIIEQYDRPKTLIYLDPPYLKRVRADKKRYRHEFTDLDHETLAEKANKIKCFAAVSGYDDDYYADLFKGWYLTKTPVTYSNTKKKPRQECLWTNYDPASTQTLTLF